MERADFRFSRRDVRAYTGWGDTQLKVHLHRLEELEYLLVHRGGRGQSFVYELLFESKGRRLETDAGGPDRRGPLTYDGKKAGLEVEKSAPGRRQVGGMSANGRVPSRTMFTGVGSALCRGGGVKALFRRPIVPADRMHALLNQYLAWLGAQNFSDDTVVTFASTIGYFLDWCRERGLDDVAEITRPVLERYQRSLYHYRKKNGEPLTFRTQNNRLRSLKSWFRWLARQNYMLHNPASELMLPRLENRLAEIHPQRGRSRDGSARSPTLRRSKACAIARFSKRFTRPGCGVMEVVNLKLYDIDRERGTVMIRQGKGKKDRHIPIGERALAWIAKYIAEARPRAAHRVRRRHGVSELVWRRRSTACS